ncbi:MAG: tetratricopeptide repeat protein, partial [Proteobacteria bacterium]|nr:tetratricopeptide repeat protein [Pseudomonadota bacterium]
MRSSGSSDLECSNYRLHLLASLIIVAVVAVIYSNTLDASFHLDDFKQIADNKALRSIDNFFSLLTVDKRGVSGVTFAINYALGGDSVFGYHITNISIHTISSLLAYFLLFLTISAFPGLRGRAKRIAFFSALLFAVHPVQTQAVTYITQRQESLSALFCLLSLLSFVLALRCGSRVKQAALYALTVLCYILAFYSKETAITLVALVFLFDIY